MKLSVIGAGSWGSAIAVAASRSHHDIMLWAFEPEVAEAIREQRTNPYFLPNAHFEENVRATNSLEEAAAFSDTIIMVAPSHHYRRVLESMKPMLPNGVRIISGTKGIENDTLERVSQITQDVLGDQLGKFACLSGPTFAVEVARNDPTAAVIGSTDIDFAQEMQAELSSPTFRLYRSDDVTGLEISGSLKNVIAIAAGVIEGIGFGFNTTAALITRGLYETRKLGIALGGKPDTFAGLAGLGDLVLTCTGALSRNRRVGVELGKGRPLDDILGETLMVAEGVRTCASARDLAEKTGVEMPIIAEMYRLLYENEAPRTAIQRLMTRALRAEAEPAQTRVTNA